MAPRKQPTSQSIYQLKITLKGARPPIWRRVQVPSDITLGKLHQIIQVTMGWEDYHLHSFLIQGQEYGQPIPETGFDIQSERSVKLSQVVRGEKSKFFYTYDFGDSWDHDIVVEKVLPVDPQVRYPVCLKGTRACPPEDCGGVWGYASLLEAIQDPSHSEYESTLEWLGDEFDPDTFDLDEVNQRLKQIRL